MRFEPITAELLTTRLQQPAHSFHLLFIIFCFPFALIKVLPGAVGQLVAFLITMPKVWFDFHCKAGIFNVLNPKFQTHSSREYSQMLMLLEKSIASSERFV